MSTAEAFWRYGECFVLVSDFFSGLQVLSQGTSLHEISELLPQFAKIITEVYQLFTISEKAQSRLNNALVLVQDYGFIVGEILTLQSLPDEATPWINRTHALVAEELGEIFFGMNELTERSPELDPESSEFLFYMNETTLEPFSMTTEANSRSQNFHVCLERLLHILLEQLQKERDQVARRIMEAHTVLFKYEKVQGVPDSEESTETCVICQSQFEENDEVRLLTCMHLFHMSCADEWLRRNPTCPVCRREIY